MKAWFIVLSPFLIVVGCATSSKDTLPTIEEIQPPNILLEESRSKESRLEYLEKARRKANDLATIWWAKYKYADMIQSEDPEEACNEFVALSQDPFFPAKDVAEVRAQIVCQVDFNESKKLSEFSKSNYDSWLRHYFEMAHEKRSKERNDHLALYEIYLRHSKQSVVQSVKLNFTRKALEQAFLVADERKVEKMKKRLHKISPKLHPEPPERTLLGVAYDHRRTRDFDLARKAYRDYLKQRRLSLKQRLKALRGIRTTYKIEKNEELYLKATEEMTSLTRKAFHTRRPTYLAAHHYSKTHQLLARTYWTLNKAEKARKILLSLSKQLRRYPNMQPEIYWLLGRIDEEKGRFKQAVLWFQTALKYNFKNRSLKQKITWYYAWNLRRIGQTQKAIRVFSHLLASLPEDSTSDRYRVLFWLAKTHADAKQKREAKLLFRDLADEDRVGYYGLLAKREINAEISIPQLEEKSLILHPTYRSRIKNWYSRFNPIYLNWLIALDEDEVSLSYIKNIARLLRKKRRASAEDWIEVLRLYHKAKHQVRLRYEIAILKREHRQEIYKKVPTLLFPTPYKKQVAMAATKFKVYPELIYAIMRQESAFNPTARSPVDAFGLMQILPRTARKIAPNNQIDYEEPKDLLSPATNIQIGSALLQDLLFRHKGQFIRTVASYNAAESAINGWFATRYRGNSVEFIEDIPYEETQTYVKLVLRNLVFYKLIRSQEGKISFPDWTFYVHDKSTQTL